MPCRCPQLFGLTLPTTDIEGADDLLQTIFIEMHMGENTCSCDWTPEQKCPSQLRAEFANGSDEQLLVGGNSAGTCGLCPMAS